MSQLTAPRSLFRSESAAAGRSRRRRRRGHPQRRRGRSIARCSRSPEPDYPRETKLDARDAKAPPRFEVKAPQGRAERHRLPDRRHRVRPPEHVRRRHSHADARSAREPGAQVQPLPHDGALLADARGDPDRPQPPHEQRGRDHGSRHGVPGQHGRAAAERHAARRDPAPERLQHGRLRQVPRDGAVGSQRVRAVRSLAHALRASTSSTASSAARPTSGRRSSTTARSRSRCRTTRTTTSRPT